ncbi:MAG: hypothetical protein LBB89_00180 [Treponema sp.]|jgi:hypothetical protein|nr:hypothetical protein [Treponema sp.]
MVKHKEIEFSTIYSQETIKNKLEEIVSNGSIFDNTNLNKNFSGYINLYNFEIHNKKSIFMYRTINYWRILIKGIMVNGDNFTNIKIRIRIFHGEIIYMYLAFLILSLVFTVDSLKSIIPIIILGIIFILITISTIFKIKGIDDEIKYYEELIIKTIIE